jgi:enoyl-CoA hydratase
LPVDLERRGPVAVLTLNRPEALNALSVDMLDDLDELLDAIEEEASLRAVVLTGAGEKAFTAGADIAHMKTASALEARAYAQRGHAITGRLESFPKPVIAAVNGYALGGGCELAMMCDLLIAADTAKFGQPEIKLGVLPGMGGSQRLTRAIGKAKAMDLILTGRNMDAEEAERAGLVSRVVPADTLLDEANKVAKTIAGMSLSASRMAKEAVNRAFESTLAEGLLYERRLFHSAFATDDQTEGMNAFTEKRPPNFRHR